MGRGKCNTKESSSYVFRYLPRRGASRVKAFAGNVPVGFDLYFPCTNFYDFSQKCVRLYEDHHEISVANRLLVYSGLYLLCCEFSEIDEGRAADYNYALGCGFSQGVLRTVANCPMIMVATWENLEGLMAASFTAITLCKPSLSWTLISVAARLCQTLGYHRLSGANAAKDPDAARKVVMFWLVYIMDRNTSLRLGRAPILQEFDISTAPLDSSTQYSNFSPGLIQLFQYWTTVANVQGRISTQLYSPAGLGESPQERARLIDSLSLDLQEAWDRREKANDEIEQIFASLAPNSFTSRCIIGGDTIMYHSTMTSILHAMSTARQTRPAALDAARAYLRTSREISHGEQVKNNMYTWSGFCHWVTLHSPLTPFTVLFSHVINNYQSSEDDLHLLENFVGSLQSARHLSDGIDKFYQLTSAFFNIAQTYVQAKTMQTSSDTDRMDAMQPAISDFDNYLSNLGFAPPLAVMDSMDSTSAAEQDSSSAFLQDWCDANVSLYGLLEEDLMNFSNIDAMLGQTNGQL
ncbi:hypothetical protein LTR37_009365 [Vermiconidia calcicola]|uniref:Uncharacterized protein n=1 Tax=Vermiconidia calcicola TaxID=1690605 RepID=A0ACC3N9G2_9PEZI|nr:hypothetical protein LTR37_009365 [Vermiconidia calcicola]